MLVGNYASMYGQQHLHIGLKECLYIDRWEYLLNGIQIPGLWGGFLDGHREGGRGSEEREGIVEEEEKGLKEGPEGGKM